MKDFFKNIARKIRPFKTIPASEVFANRLPVRSNTPGAYLMDGLRDAYLSRESSEYREKKFRIDCGNMNYLDKLEQEILSNIRTPIYHFYNHPYYIIPILNKKNSEYRKIVLDLNYAINSFVAEKDKKIFQDKDNFYYDKYTPSATAFTQSHVKKLNRLLEILKTEKETLEELRKYEIYEDFYNKLVSLNFLISVIMIREEHTRERMDFYQIN